MQTSEKRSKSKSIKKVKSKKQNPKLPTTKTVKTKLARNEIGANWKAFISQQPKEKKVKENLPPKPERYTGPFRRVRKLEGILPPPIQDETAVISPVEFVPSKSSNLEKKPNTGPKITKYIAIDCEMVGVGDDGEENMLARVSLVNKFGDCIYDKFVSPREEVVDYRTNVSGIRPENLKNATPFETVAKEVAEILRGKILVGHAVHHDLEVLLISHPRRKIRDTSRYKPFRKLSKGKTPGLRKLAKLLLDVDIQKGEHSSVEDARAAMQLYITHSKQWEEQIRTKGVQVIK